MTKTNKVFYLGSWVTGGALIIIMLIYSWIADLTGSVERSNIFYGYTLVPYLYIGLVWLLLLYKSWAAIQDGHTAVTPIKAVVFMLIPFYRYYWIFRAFRDFAGEFNAYTTRHCLAVPGISDSYFMAFSILWIVTGVLQNAIKGTGLLILLAGAYLVVGAVVVNILCSGLISLAAARQSSQQREATPVLPM